jgi:hypothetical protein
MPRLTNDELMFLRWLRTNGGAASLASSAGPGFVQRLLSAGYITNQPDPSRSGTIQLRLTANGYEALGLHGHG